MKRKKIEKTYHCILINPISFDCPKDGKFEVVRDGQFVKINAYCFSREKESKDESNND